MPSTSTHVVLGGNGVAGRETVHALLARGERVVSVGRRPATVAGAQSEIADLLNPRDVARVLEGAGVCYLTVGLPYIAKLWEAQWPAIVANVADAAIRNGTHLVYLDNVYAYGPVDGPMTEQSPINPTTRKGRVRADALRQLATARQQRGLDYTIGRSADFYGPAASTSVFNLFTIDAVVAGKNATWLYDADQPHSLTFTPDIGRSLAIIGSEPEARGHIWHLPTAAALTGREYISIAAGPDARVKVMSAMTMRIGSLFNSAARETREMAYQYTGPYIFDSSAFETAFGVEPTSIQQGMVQTLECARASR